MKREKCLRVLFGGTVSEQVESAMRRRRRTDKSIAADVPSDIKFIVADGTHHASSHADRNKKAHVNMFSLVDAMCDNVRASLRFECEESANCTCEDVFEG